MLELLSPAQNKECAIAAINCGADAIYIGAQRFGARKNASNSLDDIKEVVEYAHKFYVRVYVTINTILTDSELDRAVRLIEKLYDIGVDAIIIQDMGLLEKNLPPIPLFASTQCNITSPEKVNFLQNAGFSRIILARELSLKQIREIKEKTNAEIETFVHGALCVAYSGQCYLSYAIGGRSANRGECAQPCRKKYTLSDNQGNILAQNKHLLCLKDFNASNKLKELADAGVSSFKIEGRLKDIDYIKNVVGYYRQCLDKIAQKTSSGKIFFDFVPDPEKTFNRTFCEYFLYKRGECYNFNTPKSIGKKIGRVINCSEKYFEFSGKQINPQDGLCCFENEELKGILVNKVVGNKIFPNKPVKIPPNTTIFRNIDNEFQKKLATSKTCRKIAIDFEINQNNIKVTDEDNNSVSISINDFEESTNSEKMKSTFVSQLSKTGTSDFFVNNIVFNATTLKFIKISELNQLRRNLLNKLMQKRIENYPKLQTTRAHPQIYPKYETKDLDFRANIHNQSAKKFYEKCGCNITEMSLESTNETFKKPLMKTKHCLKFTFGMCKSPKELFLTDEKGKKYKLEFDCQNCEMTIYNTSI